MKNPITYLILISLFLASCAGRTKDSTLKVKQDEVATTPAPAAVAPTGDSLDLTDKYHSDEIDWTVGIPKGWTVLETEQLEAYDQQAEALLAPPEQENGARPKPIYLIAFQKDEYNQLTSMLEPYRERYPGEYNATFKDIKNNIYTAFRVQNVNVDTTSGIDTISGLPFLMFHTAIYDQNFQHIMNQVMYSTMYKGYDFTINISYREDENFKMLKQLLDSSTFH